MKVRDVNPGGDDGVSVFNLEESCYVDSNIRTLTLCRTGPNPVRRDYPKRSIQRQVQKREHLEDNV